MRILYSHYLTSESHPATRMARALANALAASGHEVLFHGTRATDAPVGGSAGGERRGGLRRALWFGRELARNRAGLRRDLAAIRAFAPDVVLCRQDAYQFSMPLACRRLGVPLVTHADAPVAYETRHFNQERRWHPPGLVERIERWTLRQSRAVVAISHPTARLVAGHGANRPVTVVPNGVDCDTFRPASPGERAATRTRLGIGTPLVAGFSGTFRAFHGLPLLREIIARTLDRTDLTWVLLGDGPSRHELEGLEGHPRVKFLGRRPAAEVPGVLAALDVVVVPHQRAVPEFYFCPIKVLEGMAAGAVCLASSQGDIPEMLDHGRAGRLVGSDDPTAWAAALQELFDSPETRTRLGRAARERAASAYSWTSAANAVGAVLEVARANTHPRTGHRTAAPKVLAP